MAMATRKVKMHETSRKRQTRRVLSNKTNLRVGLMAIFKNESMGIREWIEHYVWQGVDKILLINNNSTDNWKAEIKGLEQHLTLKNGLKKHAQKYYYNKLGQPWCKEHNIDILIVLDLDEYMFCKNKKNLKENLQDIFSKANRPSEIRVNWTMFGSSGHSKQPESIRKSFTMKKNGIDKNIKSIIWVKDLNKDGFRIHCHSIKGKSIKLPSIFKLNHYAIQSKEFFKKVKMSRGDASNPKTEHIRDWAYFKRYDFKDRKDIQLKELLENSDNMAT
jgi:hypothetical protein